MYINRTLLLGLLLAVTCLPFIYDWLIADPTAWYRPYLLWSAVIFLAWLGQRSRQGDEL